MAGIKKMHQLLMLPGVLWLVSCASTEQLFADYDDDFCPAPHSVVETRTIEKEVFRDRVVVKEVPTSSKVIPWNPAVFFDSNSAGLSASANKKLRANLDFLRLYPTYKISVRGFTDKHGDEDYNMKLSLKRIASVRHFYQSNSIANDRMVEIAHGELFAVDNDSTPVEDDIGRRVEMILIDHTGRPVVRNESLGSGLSE